MRGAGNEVMEVGVIFCSDAGFPLFPPPHEENYRDKTYGAEL